MSVSTFRTAAVRTPNGPGSIEIIDLPGVEPGPGEVRVEIAAASVNPVDLGVARGLFHAMGLINQPEHTGLGRDTASGELPTRVHAVMPLDQVAEAHRAMAKGGVRGRYVLKP